MPAPICDACETVAHCRRNGCIPLVPCRPPPAVVQWQARGVSCFAAGIDWFDIEDHEVAWHRSAGYAIRGLGVVESHEPQ